MSTHSIHVVTSYQPTFCLAEDRDEDVGLRLALLSIREHCPDTKVFVFRPNPSEIFKQWLHDFPCVTLVHRRPANGNSWNCKPQALLELLDQGFSEIIWLDSDLVLTRSCSSLFENLDQKFIVVAEEAKSIPAQGSAIRTRGWNLTVGREFLYTINSCVIRVTECHRALLIRWEQLLNDPHYRAAQASNVRAIHLISDQDILNALLGSVEFLDIPVASLKHGRDIIHDGSFASAYSIGERITGIFRPMPHFVHNWGAKPWIGLNRIKSLYGNYWRFQRLFLETSTYVALAKTKEKHLGIDADWLRYSSILGSLLKLFSFGHFALRGLPLTLFATMIAPLRRLLGRSGNPI